MTISELPLSLEDAPIFHGLSPEEADFLASRAKSKRFPAGDEIIHVGQASPGLYVIRSGIVAAVVRDASGVEREVSTLGRGECLGEMALMTGEPCSSAVRAISETAAWLVEPEAFAEIMERSPGLWRNFGRILSQRLARTSRNLVVQPYANTTALVIDLPDDEAALLALAAAASVARQTGETVLLVDGRSAPTRDVTQVAPVPASPGFAAMLEDRALLKEHDRCPGVGNELCGARVCLLRGEDERQVAPDEVVAVLEWLRPLYDHVIVLGRPGPGAVQGELFKRGSSISAVVSGETLDDVPDWLAEASRSLELRAKLDVSVLTGDLLDTRIIQAIENAMPRPARRLTISHASIREIAHRGDAGAPADERLRTGVDRLARQIARKEVGLALGAGGAKGFAHIGVLDVLMENRVPIDYLVGTSIGAIVGAAFTGGLPLADIEASLQGADRKLARWTLPLRSIWSDAGLVQLLRAPIPKTRFRDLQIPFAAVATDIASGREAVLRRGLIWKAAQASATVPGIFPPATNRGRHLVDGGLVNPVPGKTVRDLGADIVIAVDLMSPSARSNGQDPESGARNVLKARIPNLVEILWRSNEIMQEEVTLHSAASADITIEPKLGRVRWSDFSKRGHEYRAAGEQATREKLPEIRLLLGTVIPGS